MQPRNWLGKARRNAVSVPRPEVQTESVAVQISAARLVILHGSLRLRAALANGPASLGFN